MCDMDEEEFAEYLRWLEAARASASHPRARVAPASALGLDRPVSLPAVEA